MGAGTSAATPRPSGKPLPDAEAVVYSHGQLEEIAAETSEAERRANGAERELMDWKTAQFMEEHLGEEYDGLIISVQKYGCFVELFEVFVEGLLPIDALEEATGARCVYRERITPSSQCQRRRPPRGRGRGAAPRPRRKTETAHVAARRPRARPRGTHRPDAPPRRVRCCRGRA